MKIYETVPSVPSHLHLLNVSGVLVMLLSPAQMESTFSDRETDVHRGEGQPGPPVV